MPKHYRPAGKKKEGNAAKFMTRSQSTKHLQISLSQFRRLCILKGVFPREPKKKFKGNHHTYYHVKDMAFLEHEPLLEKFRETRAYDKKLKKALAKKNRALWLRLQRRKPGYKLDRLIRERYPKFVDALRDLDDCLTMVHVFAALPAIDRDNVGVTRIQNCRRLGHEWQAYISRTHKLRKSFISVKGIYYQAEIEGQKITWLTPHAVQQVLTDEVDFKVMLTFLEFYENLLAFVNFKLYHSISIDYPPILDPRLEALAADLYALSRHIDANKNGQVVGSQDGGSLGSDQIAEQNMGKQPDESELRLAQLQYQLPANEPGALMNLVAEASNEDEDEDTKACKHLFKNLKIFLSREVPRESLLFVISSFGGVVSWEGDGAPFKEADQSITHQIVDRSTQCHKFLSREYLQPQWIFDCINARIILPAEKYLVGREPPPHLSPFVDNEAEGYVPEYAETVKRLQAAARKEFLPLPGVGIDDIDDPQNLFVEGIITRTEANEAAQKKRKLALSLQQYYEDLINELRGAGEQPREDEGEHPREDGGEQPREDEGEQPREEPPADLEQASADANNLIMMSRKKRGLLKAIQMGDKTKRDRQELLKERRKKIEDSGKPDI